MKRTLIIIASILFMLLAAIEIYVQSDAFAERIRPYVVEPLQAALGEGARIGWVKANFIPLYLEVRDISIPDALGRQAIAVRKAKIYMNPLPLVRKQIRLSSISILEPRIHAVRSKDGMVNLEPLIERIRRNISASSPADQSQFRLLLRSITIRNGQITYADELASFRCSLSDIHIGARIDLSQESGRIDIKSSQASFSSPSYPEQSGDLHASLAYDKNTVHIKSAHLSIADASVSLAGDAGTLPDSALDLKVMVKTGPKAMKRLADLLRPSSKQETPRLQAEALIRGTSSHPEVDGTLTMAVLPFYGFTLQNAALSFAYRHDAVSLTGHAWKLSKGNQSIVIEDVAAVIGHREGGLDIKQLDMHAEDLALGLVGRASLSAGFDAQLSVESTGAGRAVQFLTSLPIEGSVGIQGRLSGALVQPKLDARIIAGPVTVRGITFSEVAGMLAFEENRISLSSVEIREHSYRYIFDGSVDLSRQEPVFSARLKVLQSDVVNIVALFYEQLPLKLSAAGELSFEGTIKNYTGSGYLKLDAGSAYGESFTKGTISARLTTGRIAFPQVVLNKGQGKVTATGWIRYDDGTYSADLESRGIDLNSVDHLDGMQLGGDFNLVIHSSGSFSRPYLQASLDLDALSYSKAPAVGFKVEAEIKDANLTVNANVSDERVILSLREKLSKPYPWTAEAHVSSEAVNPLLIAGNTEFTGNVSLSADGTVAARGKGLDLASISGKAVFQKLSMVIGDYRIDNDSDAVLAFANSKLAFTSVNFAGQGTRIGVTGWVALQNDIDLTLRGTANLSLLKLLYHEVEHAAGTADMKVTIKDDWKKPDLSGELRIQNGEIKVQDVPQRLSAVNGKIVLSQGKIVAEALSGSIGGGAMNISGSAQLEGMSLQDFSLKAAVDSVTVRYPEGLTSTLSGDLYYDGDRSVQTLSGDIAIKRARYDKRIEWKTMLVDIGKGLYQKKKSDVAWIGDTQINVRFHGVDSILLQNNLASMPLDVDVFLRGTVNHPQLLGRIEARKGVVYFRKNEFTILNASVDFIDPNRMNPVLDIQAETQVREYKIRLSVTGMADRAAVAYMSEPTLIDTDILSLLAIGKKGSEIKGKETGVGVGEAASFATGQFQDIFERRARSITGVDRFQVDPYVSKSDTSVPRVTVGKELVQNKLYVTYSSNVGATAPEQAFRLEYLLNKHFSLVGERNELGNNGADIKYRFEFK